MKIAVFLLCCMATCIVAQRGFSVFEWQREVKTREGKVLLIKESTEVNQKARTMLMSSKDPQLSAQSFSPSESLHDFDAGLVAIKPLDGSKHCFVAKVKKPFDETLKELHRRRELKEPVRQSDRRSMFAVDQRAPLESIDNNLLKEFCNNRVFIRVVDILPFPGDWKFPIYPPLLCIWGPIDIWYLDNPIRL